MLPELEDAHRPPERQPDTILEGLGVGGQLNKPACGLSENRHTEGSLEAGSPALSTSW